MSGRPSSFRDLLAAVKEAHESLDRIRKKLGAPGDYGYSTPAGEALYEIAKAEILLSSAISDAEGGGA